MLFPPLHGCDPGLVPAHVASTSGAQVCGQSPALIGVLSRELR